MCMMIVHTNINYAVMMDVHVDLPHTQGFIEL